MVAFDGSEPCERAEEYYHDVLDNENSPGVPPSVIEHIRRCDRCRRRLQCLREFLSEAENGPVSVQSQRDKRLIAKLQAQFELLDEQVTCRRVKAFLPGLLIPSTKIRVPTPITVHVDQCPACGEDLESLRALNLDAEQLRRLGRLYADNLACGFRTCLGAPSEVSGDWPGSLDRETVRCVEVSASDMFDCVVPYGMLDPSEANNNIDRCKQHLRSCADCLEKVQRLYRTLYGIMERPDSGVVTVVKTTPGGVVDSGETDPLYGDYPIDVQVLGREAERVGSVASGRWASERLRPVLRTTVLAAAMIPLAVLFFATTRSASGLNPRQVNRIVNAAPGVRVSVFGDDLTELKQEFWASRSERLLISEMAGHQTVFDLGLRRVTVVGRPEAASEALEPDDESLAWAERRLDSLLGLSVDGPLWDAELDEVENVAPEDAHFAVYELKWQSPRYGGSLEAHRWRVYIDPATERPVRTEFFNWDPIEKVLVLEETRRFEYPAEGEVRRRADALLAPK